MFTLSICGRRAHNVGNRFGLSGVSHATKATMCTSFDFRETQSRDGNNYVVHGRAMEWSTPLYSTLVVQPKGYQFKYGRFSPQIKPDITQDAEFDGLKTSSSGNSLGYWYLSIAGFDFGPFDGMNEDGLSISVLYLPGFAQYLDADSDIKETIARENAIYYANVAHYILGECQTVEDVMLKLSDKYIFDYENRFGGDSKISDIANNVTDGESKIGNDFRFPIHWSCIDANGNGIVIEMVSKKLKIYENVGVMTNSPPYDWHLSNLINYNNINAVTNIDINPVPMNQSTPKQIVNFKSDTGKVECVVPETTYPFQGQGENDSEKIDSGSCYGLGNGMHGLPGDFSPQSRFIKIYKLREAIVKYSKPKTSDEATYVSSQLLNNVDLCKGTIASQTESGGFHFDTTLWGVIKDCLNKQMKIRPYGNYDWNHFDCTKFDFTNGAKKKYFSIKNGQEITLHQQKIETTLKLI